MERDILLKSLRNSEERNMRAQRLESGALRRMRYVHWAAAQLLCVGPVLPLHEARAPVSSPLVPLCPLPPAPLYSSTCRLATCLLAACLPLTPCSLRLAPTALPLIACCSA